MKIVFVGPSLQEAATGSLRHKIEFRPPAAFGDVARAVLDGASVIGLIDGFFEDRAAVWHKEILYALSQGVRVYGAASMGALRAAECAAFGMIGVGEVFRRYHCGDLIDDDAVAQIHAPPELGYLALSEPLVNIEATAARLTALALISADEASAIVVAARRLHFKMRGFRAAIDNAAGLSASRREALADLFTSFRFDVKSADAAELLAAVEAAADVRTEIPRDWQFTETRIWRRLLVRLGETVAEHLSPQHYPAPQS